MLAVDTSLVTAASAVAAVLSFVAYLHSLRRDDRASAREEALALAETRRQMVVELQRRVRELEEALDESRGCDFRDR